MFLTDLLFEDKKFPKIMLSCKLCSYKSNRKSNFDRHMKSMHEECLNPFQCCGQVFPNKALLKSHSKEFHKNGYRCDEQSCNKVFPRKALLRRHQTVHNGIKEFSCPQCTYETSHKSNLERHCLRVHSLVIESPKQSKQKDNHKKICSTNGSLSSSQSSVSSESELNSSQELVSSHETVAKNSSDSLNSQKSTDNSFVSKNNRIEYKPNRFEDNSLALSQNDCFKIHSFEDMRISDEDSPNHRRVRLCLRPYKCLICWLLFESQLEYFEHQLLTDHMIEDSEQKERLEVIRAAAVLTQIKRSKSHPVLNV